jgi:hypothetical protein
MENKFSFLSDYNWVLRVLISCSNFIQVETSRNLLESLINKHKQYLNQKNTLYVYEQLIREEFEMAVESKLKVLKEKYSD